MIVDDEEFCISFMKQLALRAGLDTEYQIDFCFNGQEALDQVKTTTKLGQSYKVIFTDFSMPVMDGIEATSCIREFLREGSH